jgi:hypothetical protein
VLNSRRYATLQLRAQPYSLRWVIRPGSAEQGGAKELRLIAAEEEEEVR